MAATELPLLQHMRRRGNACEHVICLFQVKEQNQRRHYACGCLLGLLHCDFIKVIDSILMKAGQCRQRLYNLFIL
jgi:hypothetical protein